MGSLDGWQEKLWQKCAFNKGSKGKKRVLCGQRDAIKRHKLSEWKVALDGTVWRSLFQIIMMVFIYISRFAGNHEGCMITGYNGINGAKMFVQLLIAE